MKRYPIEVGSFVRSLAGRDAGRLFIVVEECDADFVRISDGGLRGLERPKRKRRRHVKPTGRKAGAFVEKLARGEKVEDHEVRSWLKKEEEQLVQV